MASVSSRSLGAGTHLLPLRSTWATPTNLGTGINSSANDLRASLSWDGTTLYFGSTRLGGEGSQDVYFTTRAKLTGSE